MPDARVQAAIDNWAPRFTTNGVDPNDFRDHDGAHRALGRVARRVGADRRGAPRARRGRARRGPRAHRRGGVRARGGLLPLREVRLGGRRRAQPRRRRSGRSTRSTPRTRCSIRPPSGSRRRSTAAQVVGNLRRPRDVDKPPLVVLIPGLDSTKEEFFHWEDVFLARGMATLSLDGPGPGRDRLRARHPARLRGGGRRDPRRGLGARAGRRRPRARRRGGRQPRRLLRAAGGRVRDADPGGGRHQRAVRLRRQLGRPAVAHARDDPAPHRARRRRRRRASAPRSSSLAGVARAHRAAVPRHHRPPRPADPVGATRSGSPTRRRTASGVLFDDGNHVCNNIPYKYRPLVADWMRAKLG